MAVDDATWFKRLNDFIRSAPKYPTPENNHWGSFLEKYNVYSSQAILKDENAFKTALYMSIQGEAFKTIKTHAPTRGECADKSFSQYQEFLSAYFAPSSQSDLKKSEYLARVQGKDEGMVPFLAIKYSLYCEGYEEGKRSESDFCLEATSAMYSNVIKRKVNARSPISYRDLLEKAADVVACERRAYLRGFGSVDSLDGLATTSTTTTQALVRSAPGAVPMDVNTMNAVNAIDGARECWWCQRTGHFKRECNVYLSGRPRVQAPGRGGPPRGRQMDGRGDGYRGGSGYRSGNQGNNSGYRSGNQGGYSGNRSGNPGTNSGYRSGGNPTYRGDRRRDGNSRGDGRGDGRRDGRSGPPRGINFVAEADSTSSRGRTPEPNQPEEEEEDVFCLGRPGQDF